MQFEIPFQNRFYLLLFWERGEKRERDEKWERRRKKYINWITKKTKRGYIYSTHHMIVNCGGLALVVWHHCTTLILFFR